jgi:hypothetical protein
MDGSNVFERSMANRSGTLTFNHDRVDAPFHKKSLEMNLCWQTYGCIDQSIFSFHRNDTHDSICKDSLSATSGRIIRHGRVCTDDLMSSVSFRLDSPRESQDAESLLRRWIDQEDAPSWRLAHTRAQAAVHMSSICGGGEDAEAECVGGEEGGVSRWRAMFSRESVRQSVVALADSGDGFPSALTASAQPRLARPTEAFRQALFIPLPHIRFLACFLHLCIILLVAYVCSNPRHATKGTPILPHGTPFLPCSSIHPSIHHYTNE